MLAREKEGSLYELDGRKSFPVNHGPTTPETFLAVRELSTPHCPGSCHAHVATNARASLALLNLPCHTLFAVLPRLCCV